MPSFARRLNGSAPPIRTGSAAAGRSRPSAAATLRHGLGVVIVDVVTSRSANLHAELFDVLEVEGHRAAWQSPTGLYTVAYRAVTLRKAPRVEAWPEALKLGEALPVVPLWLALDLCIPVRLEESYLAACRSLRIAGLRVRR